MKARPKQLLCAAVLILLCLLLAACVEVQMKFELRSDGSGIAGWTVEIPKGTAESLGMTSENVKEQMLKDRQFQKPGVETSIGRAANGNETVTVSMPFTSVEELTSDDMRFEFQKSPDGRQCTFGIKTRAQPVPIQVRAEVHMPGRITSSNADSVSGNVARYNNVLRGDGISVQSEIGGFLSTTMLAALLGGAAAILVIVLLLVWMNRKRARAVPVAQPAAPGGVRCRQCGAENKAGAKFCRNCGASLDAPAPAPAPAEAAKCPRCGVPVAPGKKFCPTCGAPQSVPAAAPAPPPAPEWTAEPPQPAKSSAMLIALSASLILLLLAIVLLVYKLWIRDRAAAPTAAPAQTASVVQPQAEAPAQPGEPVAPEAQPGAPEAAEPQAAAPLAGTQPAQPAGRASPTPSEPARPSPMPASQAPPAPSQPQPAYEAPTPQPSASETPAAPPAPASAAPAFTPRQQILRPAPTPAPSTPSAPPAPSYSGPRSGVIVWSGQLEREGRIEISGGTAASGALRGELPGVPVIVEIEPKDVGVAEAPSPQNGWKRLVLRSRNRRLSVVTIKWTVIQ